MCEGGVGTALFLRSLSDEKCPNSADGDQRHSDEHDSGDAATPADEGPPSPAYGATYDDADCILLDDSGTVVHVDGFTCKGQLLICGVRGP
jgi:hypothetical protein